MKNKKQIYWSILFLVVVIIFVLVSITPDNQVSCQSEKNKQTQALVRQTARWAVASQQDTSPMIALLHANYAAGYLQALELIATENEINRFVNLQELRTKVHRTQDQAARQVALSCPGYLGNNIDKELARIGMATT